MRPCRSLLLVVCCLAAPLVAAEPKEELLGTLTGQFIYDGEPPKHATITLSDGVRVDDESLVVDKKSRGIANVVVSLFQKAGEPRVPEKHPDLVLAKLAPVQVRLGGLRFEPHLAAVREGQTLVFTNEGPDETDIKADLLAVPPVAGLIAPGKALAFVPRDEKLPSTISSGRKPWMKGYVFVSPHPFVAVSDAQGRFTIRHLPVGTWTFRVWQEKTGFVELVLREGKEEKWHKGQVSLAIKEGLNDLGEIKVSKKEWE